MGSGGEHITAVSSVQGRSSAPATALFSLGLGLNLMWCTLMGHAAGFFPSSVGFGSVVNPRTLFLAGILFTSMAAIALPGFLRYHDKSLKLVIPLVAAGGTGCFGLSYSQNVFDPLLLAAMGLFVAGIGYSWTLGRFMLLIVRARGFRTVVWSVSGSLICMLITSVPLSMVRDTGSQVIIAMALPILAAVVFEVATRYLRKHADGESVSAGSSAGQAAPVKTVFGVLSRPRTMTSSSIDRGAYFIILAAGALLLAVIRALGALGTWGNAGVGIPSATMDVLEVIVISVCLVVFAYVAFIRTEKYSIEMRFIPAIAVIFAGLFIAGIQAGLGDSTIQFFNYFLLGADTFAHLLFWCVVAVALENLDVPSYRVIGIAGTLYALVSIIWVVLLSNTALINSTFISLTTYGLLVVALFSIWAVIKRSRKPGLSSGEQGGQADNATDMIAARCEHVADEHRLSPREREVLLLLAQGRTRAFIKDELVLSENTVKTHIAHIYAKMHVSDRQEMMDLLWMTNDGVE